MGRYTVGGVYYMECSMSLHVVPYVKRGEI